MNVTEQGCGLFAPFEFFPAVQSAYTRETQGAGAIAVQNQPLRRNAHGEQPRQHPGRDAPGIMQVVGVGLRT
jgi:hypothetical protein